MSCDVLVRDKGTFFGHVREMFGPYMVLFRDILDTFRGPVRITYGFCEVDVRDMSGTCQEYISDLLGICLGDVFVPTRLPKR